MRTLLSVLGLGFLLAASVPVASYATDKKPEKSSAVTFKKDTLRIESADKKTHDFKVEIAETQEQREKGLQGRTSIPEGTGMLFLFSEDTYIEMWMKDTPLSLDMLFLDSTGKIVYIAANTKPNSTTIISARRDARGVLELAGGTTEKLGIKVGDQLVHSYFTKK